MERVFSRLNDIYHKQHKLNNLVTEPNKKDRADDSTLCRHVKNYQRKGYELVGHHLIKTKSDGTKTIILMANRNLGPNTKKSEFD